MLVFTIRMFTKFNHKIVGIQDKLGHKKYESRLKLFVRSWCGFRVLMESLVFTKLYKHHKNYRIAHCVCIVLVGTQHVGT